MLEMLSNLRCVFLLVFCALFAIYCIIRAVEYSSWKFGLIMSSISLLVFLIFYPIIGCMKCGTGYYLVRTFYRCPVLNAPPSKAEKAREKEKQFLIEYQPAHPSELKKDNTVIIGEWGPDGKGFPIEWLVIKKNEDGTYLLLSKDILKLGGYIEEKKDGKLLLNDWLKKDFYEKAFTENEKKFIDGKPALLSSKEARYYSDNGGSLKASGTVYAGDNDWWQKHKSWWWLAETGDDTYHAKYVNTDGIIKYSGKKTDTENGGIRPAITYRPYKTIEIGKYPYNAKNDSDKKPIKWAILDEDKDGTLTLMAMEGIAVKPFHNKKELTAWADSDLRKWLNREFLQNTFSYAEREAIIPQYHKVLHSYTDKVYIPYEKMLSVYIECADNNFKGGYAASGNNKTGGWLLPDEFQILKPDYSLVFFAEDSIVKKAIEVDYSMPVIPVIHYNPQKYIEAKKIEKEMEVKEEEERKQRLIEEEKERERIDREKKEERERQLAELEKNAKKRAAKYKTGSLFPVGYYPYYKSGTKRQLEWKILRKYSDGTALMITRHIIDTVKYNEYKENVHWKDSYINKWLNSDFYNAAFSEEEQLSVRPAPEQLVSEAQNAGAIRNVSGYDRVSNKVFLLSAQEAEFYFKSDDKRKAFITAYTQDKMRTAESYSWWWLRSVNAVNIAPGVTPNGSIKNKGLSVNKLSVGVRPVILFDIEGYFIEQSKKALIKQDSKEKEESENTVSEVKQEEKPSEPLTINNHSENTYYHPTTRYVEERHWYSPITDIFKAIGNFFVKLWEILVTIFIWCMWGFAVICILGGLGSLFGEKDKPAGCGGIILGIIIVCCMVSCG